VWVKPDGTVDLSKVPELIPVFTGEGSNIDGCIRGADAFGPPPPLVDGRPGPDPLVPVFDCASGKELLGHLIAGEGFEPG
jgi:hypothetical protein